MKNEGRLKDIVKFVNERAGVDIRVVSRKRDIIEARTIYYMIASKATRASVETIGGIVNKDHSTVTYAKKALFDIIKQDRFYMNIYREYFNIPLDKGVVRSISDETLTDNEKAYRGLSEEDKRIYDERASLVLKSFEWKRKDDNRKEVFEIINVGM